MDLEEANFARGLPELRAAAAISPRRSVGRAPRVGLTVACAFGKPLAPFASSLWARKLTGAPPLRLAALTWRPKLHLEVRRAGMCAVNPSTRTLDGRRPLLCHDWHR